MKNTDQSGKGAGEPPSTVRYEIRPRPAAAEQASSPPHLVLEVVGGPLDGLRRRVGGSNLTIGRASDNDLILTLDPMVSARHARVVREEDGCWVEDLDSRNGVFVGSQKIQGRAPLQPGTLVGVGRTRVELLSS